MGSVGPQVPAVEQSHQECFHGISRVAAGGAKIIVSQNSMPVTEPDQLRGEDLVVAADLHRFHAVFQQDVPVVPPVDTHRFGRHPDNSNPIRGQLLLWLAQAFAGIEYNRLIAQRLHSPGKPQLLTVVEALLAGGAAIQFYNAQPHSNALRHRK